MNWLPIDTRPLPTGRYLVGHRGTQEIMHFRGPDKDWIPPIKLGWLRFTSKGWVQDNPVERFHATHCALIEAPPAAATTPDLGSERQT